MAYEVIDTSNFGRFLGKIKTLLTGFWSKEDTSELTIDSTPTANSNNLVKSGGVKSYVDGAIPTVPTISTNVEADKANDLKTASPKAVYDFVCPPKASSQPQGGMAPGIFYDLGTLTGAVTISLAAPSDANIANEWRFCFVTGSTVPTITWPQGITYAQGNVEFDSNNKPVLEADTRYECNIQEGALIIDSFLTW